MEKVKQKPLLVLFLVVFIDLLGFGLIIPILPIYASELGAPSWVIGWVAASYSLMQFAFGPVWGNLSDRWGRKPILMGSMALMACSYVLFAYSFTLMILFVSRICAGIAAANISAAQAYISDSTPPSERARHFGIIGAAFGLGFIGGPPVGGFLKAEFGVMAVGWAAAGLSIFNLLMTYFLLPESLDKKFRTKRKMENPLNRLWTSIHRPGIGRLMAFTLIFISAFSMMHVTASLFWAEEFGLSEKRIGLLFMYIGLMAALIQGFMIGHFNRWFGEKQLLIYGSALMLLGLLALPFPPSDWFYPWELFCLAVISVGNAFLTPTISSLLSRMASEDEQGAVMGAYQSYASLGRVIGPVVGGWLYGFSYQWPYVASAVLMAVCIWTALRLAWREGFHQFQTN